MTPTETNSSPLKMDGWEVRSCHRPAERSHPSPAALHVGVLALWCHGNQERFALMVRDPKSSDTGRLDHIRSLQDGPPAPRA